MSSWLIDTPLIKVLTSPPGLQLRKWCEANKPSLFLSAASITEFAGGINKTPASQRANAMRLWLEGIAHAFADRIHPVDLALSIQAGALLPRLVNSSPRHRFHDALLAATAQAHGHVMLTRRVSIFGTLTHLRIEEV